VPSAFVATLAAPLRAVQAMVGPGWSADPATDPASILGRARDALADVSAATRRTWRQTDPHWAGTGADGAAGFMASTVAALDELADHADQLTTAATTASAAVERAGERLRTIVDRFEARAAAMEPHLDSPGLAEQLLAEAQRSLAEAVAIVEELAVDLDGKAAALPSPSPTTPAPTTPAGMTTPSIPSMGSGFGGGPSMTPAAGPGGGLGTGLGGVLGDIAALSRPEAPTPDAAIFGDGVAIRLPDGSTATAPNAVAADAVRYALTQLGVPYDWGGTTPGVGLDCSGLTQWAYREAGLNIPRLAQEQDVGAAIDAGSLRPGDLAVWDGHVAMVVGNGMMIEAGDPVQLSPIRTTNAGQGFQGFWRPTA
jgi:cell wall-associated NlpC family hydrolase